MHTSQKCVKRAETLPVDEYGVAVNMSSPLFVLSNTENLSVSFCGSGFLATYQLGVAQSLLDNAPWILRGAPRVYGASAGSLVAAAVVCGSNLGIFLYLLNLELY